MSELVFYDLKQTKAMTPSMSVQVARELGRRIVAGHFPPDTLLDEETTLAERYNVSRVVLRDAVKILVGKGMLDVRRGIGTRVKPRSSWIMLDDDVLAWHLSAPPNKDFIQQLTDIRIAFEPKAAAWAAERATDADLANIEAALIKMDASRHNVDEFVVADAMFHRAILRAAHNEFLSAIEGVIYSALLVSVRVTNADKEQNDQSVPLHRDVYEAILARKPELAAGAVEVMLNDAKGRIKEGTKGL